MSRSSSSRSDQSRRIPNIGTVLNTLQEMSGQNNDPVDEVQLTNQMMSTCPRWKTDKTHAQIYIRELLELAENQNLCYKAGKDKWQIGFRDESGRQRQAAKGQGQRGQIAYGDRQGARSPRGGRAGGPSPRDRRGQDRDGQGSGQRGGRDEPGRQPGQGSGQRGGSQDDGDEYIKTVTQKKSFEDKTVTKEGGEEEKVQQKKGESQSKKVTKGHGPKDCKLCGFQLRHTKGVRNRNAESEGGRDGTQSQNAAPGQRQRRSAPQGYGSDGRGNENDPQGRYGSGGGGRDYPQGGRGGPGGGLGGGRDDPQGGRGGPGGWSNQNDPQGGGSQNDPFAAGGGGGSDDRFAPREGDNVFVYKVVHYEEHESLQTDDGSSGSDRPQASNQRPVESDRTSGIRSEDSSGGGRSRRAADSRRQSNQNVDEVQYGEDGREVGGAPIAAGSGGRANSGRQGRRCKLCGAGAEQHDSTTNHEFQPAQARVPKTTARGQNYQSSAA